MNTQLEDAIRAAVSALNVSRSEYAGGWNLYTPEDVDAAITRLRILIDDTEDRLAAVAMVLTELLRHRGK